MTTDKSYLFEKDPDHRAVTEFREGLAELGLTDQEVQDGIMARVETVAVEIAKTIGLSEKPEE